MRVQNISFSSFAKRHFRFVASPLFARIYVPISTHAKYRNRSLQSFIFTQNCVYFLFIQCKYLPKRVHYKQPFLHHNIQTQHITLQHIILQYYSYGKSPCHQPHRIKRNRPSNAFNTAILHVQRAFPTNILIFGLFFNYLFMIFVKTQGI